MCQLIISKIEKINPVNDKGGTPFHEAAINGCKDVCKYITDNNYHQREWIQKVNLENIEGNITDKPTPKFINYTLEMNKKFVAPENEPSTPVIESNLIDSEEEITDERKN